MKLSAGAEQDNRERPYHEVVTTRETTVWGRLGMQRRENLSLAFKLAHAERENSTYGTSTWFGLPENPLMRKYNLAARQRDSAGVRADLTLSEKLSLGLAVDYANDKYGDSAIGLSLARSVSVAVDASAALTEKTQLSVFAKVNASARARPAPGIRISRLDGADQDQFVSGPAFKHAMIVDKLDIGADATISRSRSDVTWSWLRRAAVRWPRPRWTA